MLVEDDQVLMLVQDGRARELLWQVVVGFTRDPELQRDLMQECLLHLWSLEGERSGRTRSWHLQACRFHLQHCPALGRSLDSPKRAGVHNRIAVDGNDEEPALHGHHTNGEVFDSVSFADVVSTLSRQIKPRERRVLSGLAKGMALREIASELRFSYPTALKFRRRTIATAAVNLGLNP